MSKAPNLLDCAAKGDVKKLEGALEDWFEVTSRKSTALHIALRCGHKEFAKRLSDKFPKLLAVGNARGETPLHYAARVGSNDLTKSFLRHAVAVPSMLLAQNEVGDTPLHEAIRSGHAEVACAMADAANKCRMENPENPHHLLNALNKNQECPLYLAVSVLSAEEVKMLMERGALPVDGPGGQTVLHAAVRMRKRDVVDLLARNYPMLVEKQATDGGTALHYAAAMGSRRMVKYLLQSNSSAACVVDSNGRSPLHLAAWTGHARTVRYLVECCPDCADIVDKNGRSVLHAAVEGERSPTVVLMLMSCKFKELINRPDNQGYTPLHLAVAKRNLTVIFALICDRRMRKNAINRDGLTALDIANLDRNLRTVRSSVTIMMMLKIGGCKGAEIPGYNGPVKSQNPKESENEKKCTTSDFLNRYFNNAILVAILITTVTFAAAFAMPGGWEKGEGLAVLGKEAAFKAFLISDTVAMCSSATVAFLFILTLFTDTSYPLHYYTIAEFLIEISLLATIVAFGTGVYVVVAPKCLWLAVVVCAGCSVPIFAFAVVASFFVRDVAFLLYSGVLKL